MAKAKNRRKVWGISYAIKVHGIWSGFIGPCGIGIMSFSAGFRNTLGGRPVFFRTRQLARDETKKQRDRTNRVQVRYRIIKYKMTWEIDNGKD